MTDCAVFYDCEFLTAPGAPQRFWCGPNDPDPVIFQVGAVRIGLEPPFDELERFEVLVQPKDRSGVPVALHPLAEKLTGVTNARLAAEGRSLAEGLDAFAQFVGDDAIWSWGKDEFNMMAISAYVEGLVPPIPAHRFGNATRLFLHAGLPLEEVQSLRSNTMADHFGIEVPDARGHDALGDARMVTAVVVHLMSTGRLDPTVLKHPTAPVPA